MDMPIDMQHQAMGYDRTATMFSPEGTILQVEYAQKTVRLGVSSIGMVCTDGVFIIADKRIKDVLIESPSRIHEIDSHIIASSAGITSDARVLVDKARVLAQQNRITYDSSIEPELIIKELSNIKQQFTQYGGARPFGVALMVAGVNSGKSELYSSDVTGNYFSYYANAIGENDAQVKELLREKYKKDIDIKKGVKIALEIFEKIQNKNFDISTLEIAYIKTKDEKLNRLQGQDINKL
ncbi:MAG: archaeal proteasome endopeptidase complex subunit alpha, partial [Nanoarchaeota archaeon]